MYEIIGYTIALSEPSFHPTTRKEYINRAVMPLNMGFTGIYK